MATVHDPLDQVREYYGKVLRGSHDLKTNACCLAERLPAHLQGLVDDIEPEVLDKFYGCGAPIPPALDGCTVLDLGCGAGRDAYLASRLVGQEGSVIGIDMTDEQLDVAQRNLKPQMARYGYAYSNVEFRKGFIEDLNAAGIEEDSIDVVISDCVINLSLDKPRVFKEIFRVLRPGGELYFSDIFADRRLPASLMNDAELHGECLAGAMYVEDFRRLMQELGCPDLRRIATSPVIIQNEAVEARVGVARFVSRTIRAFNLDSLEDRCEDYGQVAYYLGTIPAFPHRFALDDHHEFETAKPMLVCGNTAAMVHETRFKNHFRIEGDRNRHFGLFDCGGASAWTEGDPVGSGGCC